MKVPEPGGHFDQLWRQTRAHHVMLSHIADRKANMLTTISAIAASLLFALVDSPTARIPAMIMIITCVTTASFALLASMPSVRGRKRRDPRTNNPLFNPLFFGDFVSLSYEDYLAEIEAVMENHESAYEAQAREVYAMGQYLANKKYRFLRRAYVAFFTGMLASAAVWVAIQLQDSGLLDSL